MKNITVTIPLDDALNILSFTNAAIEIMRSNGINEGIEKEVHVSVIERFNLNLFHSVSKQSTNIELDTTIKFINSTL